MIPYISDSNSSSATLLQSINIISIIEATYGLMVNALVSISYDINQLCIFFGHWHITMDYSALHWYALIMSLICQMYLTSISVRFFVIIVIYLYNILLGLIFFGADTLGTPSLSPFQFFGLL